MARYPDWFDRLPSILETLRSSELNTLGRRDLQQLFGCSERDSLRLLNRFGAIKDHDALQIDRPSLLGQLEAVRDSPIFGAFRRQTGRVTAALSAAKPATQARFRRIAGSVDFQPRRLAALPQEVTLEPGRLEVRFGTEEDLWYLLDQLADIAAQDGEAFRQCVELAAT